ncbi:MAG: RDD family protein [Bdellovibrionota bacterium]
MSETSPRYAGFWIRLVAHLIDSTLLDVLALLLTLMSYGVFYWIQILAHSSGSQGGFFELVNGFWFQVLMVSFGVALSIPYYIWGQAHYGTTIGKYPFRIHVVDMKTGRKMSLKQSTIRAVSYILSYLPFCAGFLMAGFQPEKRALHDLIAGTVSVIQSKPKSKKDRGEA